MNNKLIIGIILFITGYIAAQYINPSSFLKLKSAPPSQERSYIGESITLPAPQIYGAMSVEEAMQNRRSRRAYTEESLSLAAVSQILWSLQGQTADWGGRTVPSAKGAYPLHVTVVAKNVTGLPSGVYYYIPGDHSLKLTIDNVPAMFDEAAVQGQNKSAPVSFVISGDYSAMAKAFDGKSNDENVVLEVGHAGQNAYLQVESLGLGTVVSGGFNKDLMKETLNIPSQEDLFYLIPVGVPAAEPAANAVPETTYSLDMIADHNSKDDCWQVIDSVVYNFTPYLTSDEHPGGGAMAKDCGTDASFRYKNDPPHSEYARSLLPDYAIGMLE